MWFRCKKSSKITFIFIFSNIIKVSQIRNCILKESVSLSGISYTRFDECKYSGFWYGCGPIWSNCEKTVKSPFFPFSLNELRFHKSKTAFKRVFSISGIIYSKFDECKYSGFWPGQCPMWCMCEKKKISHFCIITNIIKV